MNFTVSDIGLIAVIVGLVEVIKGVIPSAYGDLVKRISPVISLVIGVAFGFVYISPGQPEMAVLSGFVMGLSASGLYAGTKTLAGK